MSDNDLPAQQALIDADIQMTSIPAETTSFRSPLLKLAFDHWRSLKGNRELPLRSDFLPEQIRRLWPNLAVLDVLDGGSDFRIRYFGGELAWTYGELTGAVVGKDIADAGLGARALEVLRSCTRNRRPAYAYFPQSMSTRRSHVDAETLCLPFAVHGKDVEVILACIVNVPRRS